MLGKLNIATPILDFDPYGRSAKWVLKWVFASGFEWCIPFSELRSCPICVLHLFILNGNKSKLIFFLHNRINWVWKWIDFFHSYSPNNCRLYIGAQTRFAKMRRLGRAWIPISEWLGRGSIIVKDDCGLQTNFSEFWCLEIGRNTLPRVWHTTSQFANRVS